MTLTTPLSPDPAGDEARDDPRFEAIRGEMAKLSALVPATPDYALVVREAESLLETRSKHLGVAADRSLALAFVAGVDGATRGLVELAQLIETFDMHPRRPKARIAIIETLLGRLSVRVEAFDAKPEPAGET